jgi:hypothetical protein
VTGSLSVSPIVQMSLRILAGTFRRVTCLMLVAHCVAHAGAQVSTVNLAGIVEDSTGARISDTSIKLINILTGAENDCATSQDGVFLLPGMIPGAYTLQIERQGFATAQVTGLTLIAGDTKNLLIRLRVGSVTETVEIDATGITLNKVDATVGAVIDQKFVANVPVNGRSFQDLITMTPGVLTQSPQAIAGQAGPGGGLSVNGQLTNTNTFLVDGVSGNFGTANLSGTRKIPSDGSLPGLTAIGTTESLASIDALREFRILASSYSAEYGTAPGAQFMLASRSGAETGRYPIHGSVYNYRRYNQSDAVDWFNGYYPLAQVLDVGYRNFLPYHQNDVGGTLEFPIVIPKVYDGRKKTSLFASFEKLNVHQPTPFSVQYVPSWDMRQQVPTALQGIFEDFPFVGPRPGPLLIQYTEFSSVPATVLATGIRLDHVFSRSLSTFLRYSGSTSNDQALNLSSLTAMHNHSQTMTLGIADQISTMKSNEFRLGFAESSEQLSTSIDTVFLEPFTVPTDLPAALGVPASNASSQVQVYIHIPGIGESAINVDQASSSFRQWNLRDAFSLQAGVHSLRMGVGERYIVSGINPAPLSVKADFFDQNSLLNNLASDISITRTEPATPVFNEFSVFLQDEWRISRSLVLSPGLRWEVDPPPHGKNGGDAYTLLGSIGSPETLQLAPRGTPLWQTSWFNLAPRVGLAWSVNDKSGKEFVVRAGAGVYFNTDNKPAAEAFDAIGFSATAHPENVPVPVTADQLDFSTTPSAPYTKTTVFAFPRHLQMPYTFQWNVAIEQAFGRNQSLTASWVGAGGRRLLQEQRVNINTQNPQFGEINYFPGGITSSYQSLQLRFQRTISPGVQALASYVWSHALDYGATDPAFPAEYGNSDLDVRHNLQATLSWQEHRHYGNWARRHLFSGWGADGRFTVRTGFPVNLMGNLFSDPATGDRYYSGVDLIPGKALYLYGSQFPGGRMFNGGPGAVNPAFAVPNGSAAGNSPRNLLRGFGNYQLNSAIRKDIHISERLNLNLRADAFNLFNHPNLGFIDPVLSNQLFGQATLLLNQSFGTGGPLYEPGGPRSLQFSARIQF